MADELKKEVHIRSIEPSRLEFFSDAVMAIIITISVLEIKVPAGNDLAALSPLLPVFITYVVSFQTIGTYWNNHHHLLKATKGVNGAIMWANLHLLFWLSLIPFAAGWVGENHGGAWPTVLYSFILLMSAIAYMLLQQAIISCQGRDSALAAALGDDFKGKVSVTLFVVAVIAAFFNPWISDLLIVLVSVMWFIPDKRIRKIKADKVVESE